jgi:hypothetical protein
MTDGMPTPDQLQKAMLTGDWSDPKVRPKPGCKTCLGRGFAGRNTQTNRYVLCKCILKQLEKIKLKLQVGA